MFSEAFLHTLNNVCILILVAALGWLAAAKGKLDNGARITTSKIVNLSLPFFLFYAITSKFTHAQLIELLQMAGLPFVTVALNWALSELLVKAELVGKDKAGVFVAAYTGASLMFVGVPFVSALFNESAIPYLLIYFLANVTFIWTVGLYRIQLDGVARSGRPHPKLLTASSARMLLQPPLIALAIGMSVILLAIPIPGVITGTAKMFGSITSPLAIFFIGMTIWKVGFSKLRHLTRELWLILFGCYVSRPLLMYLVTLPFDMDPMMRRVFVVSASLPSSSVLAVLAKNYGADDEFASEAVGVATIGVVFMVPVMMLVVPLI